jgi:hypothetical protein
MWLSPTVEATMIRAKVFLQTLAGAAAIAVAGAWHLFLSWAEGKLSARGEQLVSPFFSSVTIDQLLTWGPPLGFTGIGIYLFFLVFRQIRGGPAPLSAAMITAASIPEYRAMFARSGEDAVFYIEFAATVSRTRDTPRVSIRAFVVPKFQAGEVVSFPLVVRNDRNSSTAFSFSSLDQDKFDAAIHDGREYKGRVTVKSAIGPAQSCYFSIQVIDDWPPYTSTESSLRHMFEWEGKAPPNGDIVKLMK